MKKPVVDYREFRFSRINEPRFSHVKLLAGWIIYFTLFFLTENLIPVEKCHVIHGFLDDVMPFCEWFVFAYIFWFVYVVGSLLYFFLYDIPAFRKLSCFIMVTQAVAMFVYIVYPNRQDLRPEVLPRQNIATWIISIIYAFDTNTGVCPSLHVGYSLGIVSVWVKQNYAPRWFKAFVVIMAVVISLSTSFIRQHSTVDILAALPLGLLAEILVYGKDYWLPRLKRA